MGWKWWVFFSPSPIQAANEKYLKPPNSGIHGEGKMEPRYPPMPFCWIAQAESFKNIPGSVDFKTHTHTRFNASEIREMPQNVWNPSKLMALYVGALRKHWKTRRFREGFNFLVPFPTIKIDYLPHVVNHGFGPPKLYWPNLLTGGVF